MPQITDNENPSARQVRIFLCHSSQDKTAVRQIYHWLRDVGTDPWFDETNLLPGQDWHQEISGAVRASDIILVCLSKTSIGKAGYVQREIRYALDAAEEQPEGVIFLIPLKLEDCEVPNRLRRWQWVNYFDPNGPDSLLQSISSRAKALGLAPVNTATDAVSTHQVEQSISTKQVSSHSPRPYYLIDMPFADVISRLQVFYGPTAKVVERLPEFRSPNDEHWLTVSLQPNLISPSPVSDLKPDAWANQVITEQTARSLGPGKIVWTGGMGATYQFLFESSSIKILDVDIEVAFSFFSDIDNISRHCRYWKPLWWEYSQFALLVFHTLSLGQFDRLISLLGEPLSDELENGLQQAITYWLMVERHTGGRTYYRYANSSQSRYDRMWKAKELKWDLSLSDRLLMMERLFSLSRHPIVGEGLKHLRYLQKKRG